ncbi:MAG TPA: NAD(P)-binding domain-containing protein [Myxococcota bacterium]|jgi:hypothetical protein
MKIAVLGTGMVGETIGSKLVALGHDVMMGSRSASNEKALAWAKKAGAKASVGTFADAARFAELGFNCTSGAGAVPAVSAGGADWNGKVIIDISNPLDGSKGFPPSLSVCNTDSLGEQVQRAVPGAHVVKSLNTVNCNLMIDATSVHGGDHSMFMSGNDASAKEKVRGILTGWFGWKDVIDLGDITCARGTEMYLPLWLRLMGFVKGPSFNIKVVR